MDTKKLGLSLIFSSTIGIAIEIALFDIYTAVAFLLIEIFIVGTLIIAINSEE